MSSKRKMKNKLWKLYSKGEERFNTELDIVTILSNLRDLERFMKKEMKERNHIYAFLKSKDNLIMLDSSDNTEMSNKNDTHHSDVVDGQIQSSII